MPGDSTTPGKIGAGHARAMARQGLNELRAVFYPDSNVAQPTEMGAYGTVTPVEVTRQRQGSAPSSTKDCSIVESPCNKRKHRGTQGHATRWSYQRSNS